MSRPASLYEGLLGPSSYAALPAAVQRFHRLRGSRELHGRVETAAPASLAGRLLAACLGSPQRASRGAIRFRLEAGVTQETWTRCFPEQRPMRSRFRAVAGGHLEERLGAARLRFELQADREEGLLRMRLIGLRFLGLPCPRWLLPRIVAQERGNGSRLHFEVSAALPWVGVVAAYRGHLELEEEGTP